MTDPVERKRSPADLARWRTLRDLCALFERADAMDFGAFLAEYHVLLTALCDLLEQQPLDPVERRYIDATIAAHRPSDPVEQRRLDAMRTALAAVPEGDDAELERVAKQLGLWDCFKDHAK